MKVTAGFAKGMVVHTPEGRGTRPTSDKVKQAIWNSLQGVEIDRMLDAFAGSGGMGLEALSRGVGHVTFVEPDRKAGACISRNLKELSRRAGAQSIEVGESVIVARDVEKANFSGAFDFIFMDPPYEQWAASGKAWIAHLLPNLTDDGWLVLESSRQTPLGDDGIAGLKVVKTKTYGDTMLTYLRKMESDHES